MIGSYYRFTSTWKDFIGTHRANDPWIFLYRYQKIPSTSQEFDLIGNDCANHFLIRLIYFSLYQFIFYFYFHRFISFFISIRMSNFDFIFLLNLLTFRSTAKVICIRYRPIRRIQNISHGHASLIIPTPTPPTTSSWAWNLLGDS